MGFTKRIDFNSSVGILLQRHRGAEDRGEMQSVILVFQIEAYQGQAYLDMAWLILFCNNALGSATGNMKSFITVP